MFAARSCVTIVLAAPLMVPSTLATGGMPKFKTGAYAVPVLVTLALAPGGSTVVVPIVMGDPTMVVPPGNSHDIRFAAKI
jgi:hypothetical protein